MILRFKTVALVVFKGFGQCRSKFLIVRFLMGKSVQLIYVKFVPKEDTTLRDSLISVPIKSRKTLFCLALLTLFAQFCFTRVKQDWKILKDHRIRASRVLNTASNIELFCEVCRGERGYLRILISAQS